MREVGGPGNVNCMHIFPNNSDGPPINYVVSRVEGGGGGGGSKIANFTW